jgi:hypothetical protein
MSTDIDTSIGASFEGVQDDKTSGIEQGMGAVGVAISEPVQEEYWGTDETYKIMFPDGVTFVECKYMTEGDRARYQGAIQKDVRVQKATGDAFMKLSTGEERQALIASVVVGWNLKRAGQDVPFSNGPRGVLKEWVEKAPPKIIDLIEKGIRLHEPWIMSDLTIEQIKDQIADLEEILAKKIEEEEGKAS